MNWIHFFSWVAGIYALYYLANILVDIAAAGRVAAGITLNNELTFSEPVKPKPMQSAPVAVPEPAQPAPKSFEPEVIASGGVPMNDIFNLARQESIIYTRSVSF